jgi:hypothetical protein
LSLGRPPSWRRAEPSPPPRHGSIHFVVFFEVFSIDAQVVGNELIFII